MTEISIMDYPFKTPANRHTNLGGLLAVICGSFGARSCRFLLSRRLKSGPALLALLLHLLTETFRELIWSANDT